MRLARTTRGTSAPPNLTAASIRLTYATITSSPLRSRRRTATTTQTTSPNNSRAQPDPRAERLGSPFAFHPFRREGTPSTVTSSLAESLHSIHPPNGPRNNGGCAAYWLRSSRESEMEFQINSLRTTGDLRRLIEMGVRQDNQWLVQRCQGILVHCLGAGGVRREDIDGMELSGLMQYAENIGFWHVNYLPGVAENNGIQFEVKEEVTLGIVDRYATPPAQIMHPQYR